MNKEGGSMLTIRKSNSITDGFKGYKATLFAGETSYTEINIPVSYTHLTLPTIRLV